MTSNVLDGIQPSFKRDLEIPWKAALKVVVPLIEVNDSSRIAAIPLFEEWIEERGEDLTVNQAAQLWINFYGQYQHEMPRRIWHWMKDMDSGAQKRPSQLTAAYFKILVAMHLQPWKLAMLQTKAGAAAYRVLTSLGYLSVFLVTLVLIHAADQLMVRMKEPVVMGLMLLGII